MKKFLCLSMFFFLFILGTIPCYAASSTNIIINGERVVFNSSTGYPFVDENNRTMVPLRVTMESAGFAVGYDNNTETAIVITPYDRIELPIWTNYIYNNNKLTENDTDAVVRDGRTYLPIRAVLESAGFTVEWDGNTGTVNAYTFNPDNDELVPYSTSSLATLVDVVLNGDVVYVNGQYYAKPEYAKAWATMKVNYVGEDLNTAIYPYDDHRMDLPEDFDFEEEYEKQSMDEDWINSYTMKVLADDSSLAFGHFFDDGELVYAFFREGISSTVIYVCDEVPDSFTDLDYNEGVFNGIRMKYENGSWFFNPDDLKNKNII